MNKMNRTYIIIGLLIIFIIIILKINKKSEHINEFDLSNENLASIASDYDNGTKIYNNLNTNEIKTKNLNAKNLKGIIVIWSGTEIPEGWALCDGTNNTPDLRGRFILGSGTGNNLTPRRLNETGGEEEQKLSLFQMARHTHDWVQVPARHDNTYHVNSYTYKSGGGSTSYNQHDMGNGTEITFVQTDTSRTGGDKITGDNKPHNNMPPYYVLAYIMKL